MNEKEIEILIENDLYRFISLLIERDDENASEDVTKEIENFSKRCTIDRDFVINKLNQMEKLRKESTGRGEGNFDRYIIDQNRDSKERE